jgi:hypothetical protein
MTTTEIQCCCGAVKVELAGEPIAQFYCHCDDCQTAHGAGFIAVAMFRASDVKVTQGSPFTFMVKATPRTTCGACGTRIFAEPPGLGVRAVTAHRLPAGRFKPAFHMFCRHAIVPLRDELPHYEGVPAAFGGSDETVSW